MFSVIPYQTEYATSVSQLFHDAIHGIDEEYYSFEDKSAWSSKPRSAYHWHKRMSRSKAWLMIDESTLIDGQSKCCGFINIETGFYTRGYIDSLYVHPAYQGKGIAKALYQTLEQWGAEQGYRELMVDASSLSKALFLSQGFKLCHRSYQEKRGRVIMGYLMKKQL